MANINKTKFEEELQISQFWIKHDPNIVKEEQLANHENILVHTVPLVSDLNKQYVSNNQIYSVFQRVLFLPSYFYQNDQYVLQIKEQDINLLNCMYIVSKCYPKNTILVCLQEYTGERNIFASYEIFCRDNQNNEIKDLSAGILGGKYILIAIQQEERIIIKVLNLDLTLVFEYTKNSFRYIPSINKQASLNYFQTDMDYYEPGIIFYLNRMICFRIDLNKQEIIEKEFMENEKQLIRLLPITSSEYQYYFKNSKKESLVGYNNSNEDKLILFVLMDDIIYQINMFNLEIIRVTRFTNVYRSSYSRNSPNRQIWVTPVHLKDRQRKKFSDWNFLIQNNNGSYEIFDWKEKSLFYKKKPSNIDEQILYGHSSTQRFIFNNEGLYILFTYQWIDQGWYRKDNPFIQRIKVQKKKGEKNYEYQQQNLTERVSPHFQENFFIKHYLNPIIYMNEITFPCLMEKAHDRNYLILNFLGFYSFKQQAKVQSKYIIEELKEQQICQMYKKNGIQSSTILINNNIIFYQFNENSFDKQIFPLPQQNNAMNIKDYYLDQNTLTQIIFTQEVDWYSLYSYQLFKREDRDPIKIIDVKQIQTNIKCYSNLTVDKKSNQSFIPMVYYNELNELYFGIYHLNERCIIQNTVHQSNYTKALLTHYDQDTQSFIIIFLKKITNKCYIFFYRLDMNSHHFKFINYHQFKDGFDMQLSSQSLFIKESLYNFFIPQLNTLISYDSKKKFEIKNIINHYLMKNDQEYDYDSPSQYFKYEQNQQDLIVNLGYYQSYSSRNSQSLNIYDIKNKSVQFVSFNLLDDQVPSQSYLLQQLSDSEILIYFINSDNSINQRIYQLKSNF